MTLDMHLAGIPTPTQEQEGPSDPRPAWERVAYTWLAREVDHGQPVDPAELAAEVGVAPRFAGDMLRVLRAHRQREPELAELRARLVRDRITDAYLTRELASGERLDPVALAGEVGTTATVARQWLHTLRAGQQTDRRLASLRADRVSHGRPTAEQLAALQAAYAGGGRPQPNQPSSPGWALERIEQLYQHHEVARGQPLDPAAVAREVGVSEHYVRGTLLALRGGTLTSAQRITQLWRLWEAEGGQRLEFADVARLVGVREGRVRQVLGPLRTAHRNATSDQVERPVMIEDGGRQAWLDQAACRDLDPERFFPEPGEQVKAAEAKQVCGSCQVRDHCLELAVKAAGGIDADHGVFGGTLPSERSPLRGNRFPEPSAYRQHRELAEQAHRLAGEVGLRQAARRLGIHRDALKAAFTQWGLPTLERRHGWPPSQFLADRAEAERAFALAERLGSVNAAATQLGTTWPSLRNAFTRHGLGMPARNPEAVRQRAVDAARQRSGQPATPSLDPVFVTLNHGVIPTRARTGGELAERCGAPRTTRPSAPGWWWSCTAKATRPSPAPAPGRSPAVPTVPTAATSTVCSAANAARPTAPAAPTDPTNPRRGGQLPMPADPIHPDQLGGVARFRADLAAYLDSLPVHELADLLGELPSTRGGAAAVPTHRRPESCDGRYTRLAAGRTPRAGAAAQAA
jgi:WhiB family transcriptional regulator, redox-sensing transcriptional regulator